MMILLSEMAGTKASHIILSLLHIIGDRRSPGLKLTMPSLPQDMHLKLSPSSV